MLQKLLKLEHRERREGPAFLVPDVAKLRHFLEFLQMKAQFGDLA